MLSRSHSTGKGTGAARGEERVVRAEVSTTVVRATYPRSGIRAVVLWSWLWQWEVEAARLAAKKEGRGEREGGGRKKGGGIEVGLR